MSIVKHCKLALIFVFSAALTLSFAAEERIDPEINARIRQEGLQNSQVMRTLHYLTDVSGPRVTGSPSLKAAGDWAIKQMEAWGTHTHHTNLDTYERVIEEDVTRAAIIVASAIYHLAMRDDMLPRFTPSEMLAPPAARGVQ